MRRCRLVTRSQGLAHCARGPAPSSRPAPVSWLSRRPPPWSSRLRLSFAIAPEMRKCLSRLREDLKNRFSQLGNIIYHFVTSGPIWPFSRNVGPYAKRPPILTDQRPVALNATHTRPQRHTCPSRLREGLKNRFSLRGNIISRLERSGPIWPFSRNVGPYAKTRPYRAKRKTAGKSVKPGCPVRRLNLSRGTSALYHISVSTSIIYHQRADCQQGSPRRCKPRHRPVRGPRR